MRDGTQPQLAVLRDLGVADTSSYRVVEFGDVDFDVDVFQGLGLPASTCERSGGGVGGIGPDSGPYAVCCLI